MKKSKIINKIGISITGDISFIKTNSVLSLNEKEAKHFLNSDDDSDNKKSSSSSSSSSSMDSDMLRSCDARKNQKKKKYTIFEVYTNTETSDEKNSPQLTETETRIVKDQLFYIACISIIGKLTHINNKTLIKKHKIIPIVLDINDCLKSHHQNIKSLKDIESYDVLKSFLVKDHVNLVFSQMKKLSKIVLDRDVKSSLRPEIEKISRKFWDVNFVDKQNLHCRSSSSSSSSSSKNALLCMIKKLMDDCTIAWFIKSDSKELNKSRVMLIGYSKVFNLSRDEMKSRFVFEEMDLYFNMIVRDLEKDLKELKNQKIRISGMNEKRRMKKKYKTKTKNDDDHFGSSDVKDKKKLMTIFPNVFFTQ